MDQGFIDILKKLVKEQGNGALTDAGKCKALLADYTGSEYRKERRFVVQAVEAGAAKAIAGADDLAACRKAQVRGLEEEYGLTPAVAAGVVDALALVLRGDSTGTQAETPPTPQAATSTASESSAQKFLDRGIMFAMRGDYDIAVEEFTDAIKANPEMPNAYMLRGRALYASVSKIISVEGNFDHIDVFIPSKVSAEQVRIYDRAIEDFNRAIALGRNNDWAYIERGVAYAHKGDFDSAIKDFNQAIRLEPNSAHAYEHRGDVYNTRGEYDRAIADYTMAISLDPYNVNAYMNRGDSYAWKSRYDEAVSDLTTAISLDSNNAIAYTNRGQAYSMKGQHDEAISDFTTAISLDPNYAFAYTCRGNSYAWKGQFDQAISDLTTAINLDPNNQVAKEILKKVRGW